jgi:hypothetical protein
VRLAVSGSFTGKDVLEAMKGQKLYRDNPTGT